MSTFSWSDSMIYGDLPGVLHWCWASAVQVVRDDSDLAIWWKPLRRPDMASSPCLPVCEAVQLQHKVSHKYKHTKEMEQCKSDILDIQYYCDIFCWNLVWLSYLSQTHVRDFNAFEILFLPHWIGSGSTADNDGCVWRAFPLHCQVFLLWCSIQI